MNIKDFRVFVCSVCTGKTFLAQKNDKFIDLDALKINYKYGYYNKSHQELEFLKHNRDKKNIKDTSSFLKEKFNYFLNNTNKIILLSNDEGVFKFLKENKIKFCYVYTGEESKEYITKLMEMRGNQKNCVENTLNHYFPKSLDFVKNSGHPYCIKLQEGRFLEDLFEPFL